MNHHSDVSEAAAMGVPHPVTPPVKLRAGQLSLLFDKSSGFVRFIRFGQVEVLRGIHAAIRDRNWDTLEPVISSCTIKQSDTEFRISFQADCSNEREHYRWQGDVHGTANGEVHYTFSGVAITDIDRNRIGFCILHPTSCAGLPAEIETPDGQRESVRFPESISPRQPMLNLRQITHQPTSGMNVRVRMEGDTFEMEDQRNWTDASFKTYCTPLSEPFPVRVSASEQVQQSVHLSIQAEGFETDSFSAPSIEEVETVVEIADQSPSIPMPQLGLGSASHRQPLSRRETELLRKLNLSHLRFDLELWGATWRDDLKRAAAESTNLGVPLEIALFVTDDAQAELASFAQSVRTLLESDSTFSIVRWLVFHRDEKTTSDRWIRMANEHLSDVALGATLGSGTNAYFTELNREPVAADGLDFVGYSINPQVHAFDNLSLVETLEVQGETVRSARSLMNDLPIVVSPVTLKPRFNPNATSGDTKAAGAGLPVEVDVRQSTLFAAGWTLASIKYLGEESVSAVTYYETSGWRGVIETEDGPPDSHLFHSAPNAIYPVYFVFQALADYRTGEIIRSQSSQPLAVESLVVQSGSKRRILLANLSSESQMVRVADVQGDWTMRSLDSKNVSEAMAGGDGSFDQSNKSLLNADPRGLALKLAPYAFVILDQRGCGDD